MAKPYRRIFVPSRPGYCFIECDQSQAELRFAAIESGDPVMLSAYRNGEDIHSLTASRILGLPLGKITKEHRQQAKAVNFGLLYGMGVEGLVNYARASYGVEFSKKEAEKVRDVYFRTYLKLLEWHARRKSEVRGKGYVRGLLGALRRLPSIGSGDRGVQAEAERQAVNSPIQRVASDVTLICMIQFTEGCPEWVLPVGTIHDSGVVECPVHESGKVGSWLKWCFLNPPLEELFGVKLPIPLGADLARGPDLGSMEEFEVEAVKPPWIRR